MGYASSLGRNQSFLFLIYYLRKSSSWDELTGIYPRWASNFDRIMGAGARDSGIYRAGPPSESREGGEGGNETYVHRVPRRSVLSSLKELPGGELGGPSLEARLERPPEPWPPEVGVAQLPADVTVTGRTLLSTLSRPVWPRQPAWARALPPCCAAACSWCTWAPPGPRQRGHLISTHLDISQGAPAYF